MSPPKPPAARKPPHKLAHRPHSKPVEVIHPLWLAKALALSLVAALLCAWLTLCLLFYQGDWQLILHPSPSVPKTPSSAGLAFDTIRFDAAETGQPRLTAWDIPVATAPAAKYSAFTILYLHDGTGSLADTLPTLTLLHSAGINIFAIDYRGFGLSDPSHHPSATTMAEDSAATLTYLISTRHIPATQIIPYGVGLGASLAVSLALAHPELPAVILQDPDPNPTATALAANSSNLIPVRLLLHQQFEITAPLSTLPTPKLLIAGNPASPLTPANLPAIQTLYKQAASPSYSVTLPATNSASAYQTAMTRFLDQYLPSAPPTH
jgi:uncharacterized protein